MATDLLNFAEEDTEEPLVPSASPWKLLIVDDDPFVHKVTQLVLRDYQFDGRKLEMVSAHSAAEGRKALLETPDVACILLDVVMETPQAGLDMAAWIRNELGNTMTRIILRTGQPGEAPEQEVIFKYDINDYKEKAELTAQKLFTTVTTAIRSYRDIRTIERNRQGLARIVNASPSLFRQQSLGDFASGVLAQLAAAMCMDDHCLMARSSGLAVTRTQDQFKVIAATGRFNSLRNQPISTIPDVMAQTCIQKAAESRQHAFCANAFAGYYETSTGSESIIYFEGSEAMESADRELIRAFSTNIAVAFDNVDTFRNADREQESLLISLGDALEGRTPDTAKHVRRVSEYAHLLALKAGMSTSEANPLKTAALLHDVGKICIPDTILLKPGPLTDQEYAIMKTHSALGHSIVAQSERPTIALAGKVTLEHHENWDGSGYPNGLAGEAISLAGRITRIADVFDSLNCDRPYRKAWAPEAIWKYMLDGKGTLFDPVLIDLFLSDPKALQAISNRPVGA